MNPDNLGLLLYSDNFTNRDLLKVIAYQEIKPDELAESREKQIEGMIDDEIKKLGDTYLTERIKKSVLTELKSKLKEVK